MTQHRKEVEIHLPLESLMDTICCLPQEDLEEIKRRIEEQMRASAQTSEDADFWDTDLGHEILSEADPSISLDKILKITAKIKGSLATDVMAERAER